MKGLSWQLSIFYEKFSALSRCLLLLVKITRIEIIDFGLYIVRHKVAVIINEISQDKYRIQLRANNGVKCRNKNGMRFQLPVNRSEGIQFYRNIDELILICFSFQSFINPKRKISELLLHIFLLTFVISISGHLFLRKFIFLTFLPETYIEIMSIVCDGQVI